MPCAGSGMTRAEVAAKTIMCPFGRLSRVSWKLRWRSPARTSREVGVGRPPRHHRQGTAVTKKYQKQKIDTPTGDGLVVPERVSVAMAEIAGSMHEGLLALAVGTGLQVMQALMEADVTAAAGPKSKHNPQRAAVRHGHERGSVTLGGRRVPVSRPRVRAVDGSGELPVPTYELFGGTEILGAMAMERMLAGLSTRRYPVGLEPVGERVDATASATSKSAVSRKFVAATETALAQLLAADLSALDLVALMIDGVHFGESVCIIALGIDEQGTKHPLALVEGSTENATVVTDLLTGLRQRGAGRDPADPGGNRRGEGPVPGRGRRLRSPGDPALPVAQDPQRRRPSTAAAARPGRHEDAAGLPRRLRPRRRSPPERAGPGTGQDPPQRGGQPARGPHRDPHRAAPGRAADAGPHPALDQRDRVDDLHLPDPLGQRQALARRSDGAALVRRGHGRSGQAVPPGQRSPAPGEAARRARRRNRGNRHPRRAG